MKNFQILSENKINHESLIINENNKLFDSKLKDLIDSIDVFLIYSYIFWIKKLFLFLNNKIKSVICI